MPKLHSCEGNYNTGRVLNYCTNLQHTVMTILGGSEGQRVAE